MAHMKAYPKNYEQAAAVLKNRDQLKLGNNTWLVRHPGRIAVKLHRTDVVVFHDNGDVRLYTGGWHTVTTKDRINDFVEPNVYQANHQWWVRFSDSLTVKFHEGINVAGAEFTGKELQLEDAAAAADFRVQNEGTIFLLHVLSLAAKAWVKEHIRDCQWFGTAVVVEHRYIADLVAGIEQDGLRVE